MMDEFRVRTRVMSLTELLLKRGLTIDSALDICGARQITPLMLSVKKGDLAVSRLLVSAGADCNVQCCDLAMTPLHMASYTGREEMVSFLLQNGARVDVMDKWNYTPLIYAALCPEPHTVMCLFRCLVDGGSDVNYGACLSAGGQMENIVDDREWRAQNNTEEGYSDAYSRQPMGATSGCAIHHAVLNPHLPKEVLQVLLEAGADVDRRNLHGQTALILCMMDKFYDHHPHTRDKAHLLLAYGASVNVSDNHGWRACHWAARRGSISRLRLLMSYHCDVDATVSKSVSTLWMLMIYGNFEAAEFLIGSGCDMDRQVWNADISRMKETDYDWCPIGWLSPLDFAIFNCQFGVAWYLLRANCKISPLSTFANPLFQLPKYNQFTHVLEDFLYKKQMKMRTLKELCRDFVRRSLGRNIVQKLEHLELPKVLIDYLCFKLDL